MMLCSDVESMTQVVPEFVNTEDWLQLVLHEYFHSFQFSHPESIHYLANTIQVASQELDQVYEENIWFQEDLQLENELLLRSIAEVCLDSVYLHLTTIKNIRESRRYKNNVQYDIDLNTLEDFWETIEETSPVCRILFGR